MSAPVVLPPMPAAAEQWWLGLLDVADAVPDRWSLVGGRMAHLHCWERERAQIDVLIARFLGERAQNRTGVAGGTLLPTPGATSMTSLRWCSPAPRCGG